MTAEEEVFLAQRIEKGDEQARKQLKMIKPGEILYVLPDDEDTESDGTDKEKQNDSKTVQ